jgi:nitronate monooxygenase
MVGIGLTISVYQRVVQMKRPRDGSVANDRKRTWQSCSDTTTRYVSFCFVSICDLPRHNMALVARSASRFRDNMIQTRVCELLGVQYPIALGGLGGGHTRPELVAAVSEAGGFGALGCFQLTTDQIHEAAVAIR